MTVDPGTVIGVSGAVLALISLAYTRSQAAAQRAQVEEMRRQTEHMRRAQLFETSHTLMRDAMTARHDWMKNFKREWTPPGAAAELTVMMTHLGDMQAFSN